MGVLLFKLNGVLEDEAEDIRELLVARDIAFYETSAGNWGVSLAAIWLNDEAQLPAARAIVDSYQADRLTQARKAYREQQAQGDIDTFWGRVRRDPWKAFLYLWPVALILYLSMTLFLNAWGE